MAHKKIFKKNHFPQKKNMAHKKKKKTKKKTSRIQKTSKVVDGLRAPKPMMEDGRLAGDKHEYLEPFCCDLPSRTWICLPEALQKMRKIIPKRYLSKAKNKKSPEKQNQEKSRKK